MTVGPALLTSPDDVIARYEWRNRLSKGALAIEALALFAIVAIDHKLGRPAEKTFRAWQIDLGLIAVTGVYWWTLADQPAKEARSLIERLEKKPVQSSTGIPSDDFVDLRRHCNPALHDSIASWLETYERIEGAPELCRALKDKTLSVGGKKLKAFTVYRGRVLNSRYWATTQGQPRARAQLIFWEGFKDNPTSTNRWEDAESRLRLRYGKDWEKQIASVDDQDLKGVIQGQMGRS